MIPRTVPQAPAPSSANAPAPILLRATDLTTRPDARSLWRPAAPAAPRPFTPPATGRPSPMGFWLAEDSANADPATTNWPYELRVHPPGSPYPAVAAPPPPGQPRRPAQTVKIKGEGDLTLTLDATSARIIAGKSAWASLSEPVTLAVCQYWRLAAVDAQLDRLTESAQADLGHASMTAPSTILHGRRIVALNVAVRALLLDQAHFAAPLTDPYPFLSSDRAVETYQALAEKLHLDEWAESIDERFEMVEDTYACATEKLFEFKNFAWGFTLEAIIILLLAAEVGVQLLSYWSVE
ncbi:MAG: hypothetical protein NVSMB9_33350 [Isosphaeraceae bacterium]